ncbi:MAG: acyl-CoA dehydrogenase family protein, partial [Thermoplasmata archaeon]|nr:acyl-CoA dehydrogenase family protein [Thermoplasmata archaeon]
MTTRPNSPVPAGPLAAEVDSALLDLRLAARSRELDRSPAFPRAEFRALGERKLLGLRTAGEFGGRGLPLREVAATLHALAYGSGTTFAKLSLQPEFCGVLASYGSERLRSEFFRPLINGKLLIGNQVTEPGAGSDAGAL